MSEPPPKKKARRQKSPWKFIRRGNSRWCHDPNANPRLPRYPPLEDNPAWRADENDDDDDDDVNEVNALPDLSTFRPAPGKQHVKPSELKNALVCAAITGQLDYLRSAFHDPDIVKTATYIWDHNTTCRFYGSDDGYYGARNSCCTKQQRQLFSPANLAVYSSERSLDIPILIHACEHGHVDIVQYLLDQGADINKFIHKRALFGNSQTHAMDDRSPLLASCRSGFEDIACLLIERGAILTPGNTYVTRHRSSHDKYYGQSVSLNTPLTYAVDNGMVDTVKMLIEHGILNETSTMPGTHNQAESSDQPGNTDYARELVGYSVREAINGAWSRLTTKGFNKNCDIAKLSRVLEILGQSGVSLFSLCEKAKDDTRTFETCDVEGEKRLRRQLYREYFTDAGPEPHIVALIRGLRPVNNDCLKDCGVVLPKTQIPLLIDIEWKRKYWDSEVEFLSIRAKERAWMGPWADLFVLAAEPWSRRNHHLFPEGVRRHAYELFLVGSRISKNLDVTGVAGTSSMIDAWENNVIPFIIG